MGTNFLNKKSAWRKIVRIFVTCLLIIGVLGGGGWYLYGKYKGSSQVAVTRQYKKAMKGNIKVTVTGSGPIAAAERKEVTPLSNGTITKVFFNEGDIVKTGDVLFLVDNADALSNINKINNNISQTQLTYNGNNEDIKKLNVYAPFSGTLSGFNVKAGDVLNKNTTIATLTNTSKLKLTVPFTSNIANGISVGQKTTVFLEGLMQNVSGTVSYISASSYSTSSGGEVKDVEVTIENPGSLKEGIKANIEVKINGAAFSSVSSGMLSSYESGAVRCDSQGTVSNVYAKDNQFVNKGQLLITLKNDDLNVAKETTEIKMNDYKEQLESAKKQLDNYKITAPIDGKIVKQEVKEGDVIKSGQTLNTISNISLLEFAVSIDELDIEKVKVGQKVNVTVDAVTETSSKPILGEVTRIEPEGTASNGVTTYPVTIKIQENDKIKIGMNANAEILAVEKNDVLYVPIEAVQKMGNRSIVVMKAENSANNTQNGLGLGSSNVRGQKNSNADNEQQVQSRQNGQSGQQSGNRNSSNRSNQTNSTSRPTSINSQYYANTKRVPVEVGINNETYIEIVSGLKVGDEVILPPVATSTQQNSSTQTRTPFGGGGLSGGFGGGGNSGGNRSR